MVIPLAKTGPEALSPRSPRQVAGHLLRELIAKLLTRIAADELKQKVAGHQFGIVRFPVNALPVIPYSRAIPGSLNPP
jgi:hypothetical protein